MLPGRAPAVQIALRVQPAGLAHQVHVASRPFPLVDQPALVGVSGDADVGCDPLQAAAYSALQQPLGREQRHLGVVGDPAEATEDRGVVGDAHRSERREDLGPALQFDRSAGRIAQSAAQRTAEKTVTRGDSPYGRARLPAPGRVHGVPAHNRP